MKVEVMDLAGEAMQHQNRRRSRGRRALVDDMKADAGHVDKTTDRRDASFDRTSDEPCERAQQSQDGEQHHHDINEYVHLVNPRTKDQYRMGIRRSRNAPIRAS